MCSKFLAKWSVFKNWFSQSCLQNISHLRHNNCFFVAKGGVFCSQVTSRKHSRPAPQALTLFLKRLSFQWASHVTPCHTCRCFEKGSLYSLNDPSITFKEQMHRFNLFPENPVSFSFSLFPFFRISLSDLTLDAGLFRPHIATPHLLATAAAAISSPPPAPSMRNRKSNTPEPEQAEKKQNSTCSAKPKETAWRR